MTSKSRNILSMLLFLFLLISLCALCVSGASVLLSEVVSKESTGDSGNPAIDVDSKGIVSAVWVDSTDLPDKNNGPDKDIFYNYRQANQWSGLSLVNNEFTGGVEVISNASITSSIQPDIAVDSGNVTHVVWSAVEPPAELTADANTTFLMHFNSLTQADYAAGSSSVTSSGASLSSNALLTKSVLLQGSGSYLNLSAANNFNSTKGTIEFWSNSLEDIQRKAEPGILFKLANQSSGEYLEIKAAGNYQPGIIVSIYGNVHLKSEPSYVYPIGENEWHHVALTYDTTTPNSSEFKLYIDGYLAASNTTNLTQLFYFNEMCLGDCINTQNKADARIDELMISKNVKSAAVIKQHAGNRSIFYRTITNNSALSTQTRLSVTTNLTYYPRIAIDQDDNIHLVYNELHNRSSLAVMYMLKNSTDWSVPELLSNTSIACMPDIAVEPNKTAHVVFEEFSDDNHNISYIHHKKKEFGGSWSAGENVSNPTYSSFANHDYYNRSTISGYFPKRPGITIGDDNVTRIVWADNINYPDQDLTFYASYNTNFDADYAAGSTTVESGNVSLAEGTHGEHYNKDFFFTKTGVNLTNTTSHLNYSAASNFNITKGTISMWVKPYFDPSDTDINHSSVLFASLQPDETHHVNQYNQLKTGNNSMVVMFRGDWGPYASIYVIFYDNESDPYAAATSPEDWVAGEWNHVGVRWELNNSDGHREINISINGVFMPISSRYPDNNNPIHIDDQYSRFFVGSAYNNSIGYFNETNGTIDEFRIYNDTRTEQEFYSDMVNDYDIFYREYASGLGWSVIHLVSNESNHMALNPAIISYPGDKAYITWSQAESNCDLASSVFTHCTLFRTAAAVYDGSMQQLGSVSDEGRSEAFYPDIASYSDKIFYAWEDNTDITGTDMDIQFRETTTSAKPVVNVTSDLDGKIFYVDPSDSNTHIISLNATATDSDSTVMNVTFYYTPDGLRGRLACTDYTSPYRCSWNMTGAAEGHYKIKAVAVSNDGGEGWDMNEVYFYVDNNPGITKYTPYRGHENNSLWSKGYSNWTDSERPDPVQGDFGTAADASGLLLISSLDRAYGTVSLPPSCSAGDYVNAGIAELFINESPSSMKTISFHSYGRGYEGTNYLTNLSIWNFDTGEWESIDYKDYTAEGEDDMLGAFVSGNTEDYLQQQNRSLYVLVETQDYHSFSNCSGTTTPPIPFFSTLYVDYFEYSASTCTIPANNMQVTSDTTLCRGAYSIADTDSTSSPGVIQITGSSLVLDCNNSLIDGGGDGSQGYGIGILVDNAEDVVIKNCNLTGYETAVKINNSGNISFINSYVFNNHNGVEAEASNQSVVRNVTARDSGYSAIFLTGTSQGSTIKDNTLIDNFLGIALKNSGSNTIQNNLINSTALGNYIGGIAIYNSSDSNNIDNNTIKRFRFGIFTGDIGGYLTGASSGQAGSFNNFSRNTINNNTVGLGIVFPSNMDYFNYYEQSNTVNGEAIYYYVNTHGTSSAYQQVSLNLNATNTSLSAGKITLVNCTYFNITDSILKNSHNGIVLINSTNIIISNNTFDNMEDIYQMHSSYGEISGAGLKIVSSRNVAAFDNTAGQGVFGFVFMNNSRQLNFTDNIAENNTNSGFYADSVNISYFIQNNATNNTNYGIYMNNAVNSTVQESYASSNDYGIYLNYSSLSLLDNTLLRNNLAGLYVHNCREPFTFTSNLVQDNAGSGIIIDSCEDSSLSGISTRNNTLGGIDIRNSAGLSLDSLQSNQSMWGIVLNNTNTTGISDFYAANNTDSQVLFYKSQQNTILNSVIVNNISADDVSSSLLSYNNLLNTTFNKSSTIYGDSVSNLSVRWHLDFFVQDNESAIMTETIPISNVNISVEDTFGGSKEMLFTDSYGYAYFNATEYTENSTGRRYFSNYSWDLTRPGYEFVPNAITPYVNETNMTANRFLNLSMVLTGGITDTDPPTNPVVVDGPNYVDIDWFSNTTSLSASWYNSTDRHLIFYSYRILENGTCLPGYCTETYAGLNTTVTVGNLTLTEGMNYTFAVRARDSLYWYTPFVYSDGAIADFTAPNVTINSTTHPNESAWYNDANVTFEFYGNDSLSGVAGFSYILDQNSGTGPDLIAESRPETALQEIKNNGYHSVLKANSTNEAFAVFYEVKGNLSAGDNVTISFQLSEDVSDRTDEMSVKAYIVGRSTEIDNYDETIDSISTASIITDDISHKSYSSADTYSTSVTATASATDSFFVVVAGLNTDDDNTHNLSIAGTDTGVDNTTQALLCGETSGCTNVTASADYAISVRKISGNDIWTKTYENLANGVYYLHVRALDAAGNWGEPEHYRIQIDAVGGAPQFVNIKPRGYIVTTSPMLAVETNEYAACYYNTSNSSYMLMTSYDGIYHESELILSEGNHTYGFNCTDRAGNSAYNSTFFIIDPAATPDDATIWPMDEYTAGQRISVYVNVTKDYGGLPYGLGELSASFSANLTNSTPSKYGLPIGVTDRGDGLYSVEFTAPIVAGTYTLTIGVAGVIDTETFVVNSYSLTIRYAGTIDTVTAKSRMVYGTSAHDYAVGLAADTEPSVISGTTSQLQLKYIAVNGNGLIFFANPLGDINAKSSYLDDGTFLDLKNPSFGQDTFQEEHIASTILDYNNLHILADDVVYEGRYSLLIRNDGINRSSGKTKITIEII